ncbi:DUF1995 family protein [Romeria aff. gracilis LEGE 07310]|uniref:DUF1995 family protein n=1 Tax=Vasconcelosia minhoensis LEGE 07310 TaxID=915328 RepID=A0A8J7DAU2_9CYAN|nr:DUF1995 family protein [Romeria gracilis]MBE9076822.1 DUF1995 family protein [Romeria aff. gracilis LEGE 07310]
MTIPSSLEAATEQAIAATQAAIRDGYGRLQVEMAIAELKQQPIAEQFLSVFEPLSLKFKVFFPDAGAAALAKRDWQNPDFSIRGLTEAREPAAPEDEAFLVVNPSSVEVSQVEQLCEVALDRPVIILNPKLEDVSTIGIGYAGRQLRDRFLSTLETCYYLRPMEGAAVLRCYPQPWQIWKEQDGQYELLTELPQRPSGEALERILYGSDETQSDKDASEGSSKPRRGLLSELQQLFRALSQ